jgi:hypothetical protein
VKLCVFAIIAFSRIAFATDLSGCIGQALTILNEDSVDNSAPTRLITREPNFIQSVDLKHDLSGNKNGALNSGVFRVKTPEGSMILKISTSGFNFHNVNETIAIQQMLANRRMAPKIYGYLTEETIKLLKKEGKLNFYVELQKGRTFGVLMQEVPGAVNTKNEGLLAKNIDKWNVDHISKRMAEIVAFLTEQRIEIGDLQFLISENGEPYLIDTDFFKLSDKPGRTLSKNLGYLKQVRESLKKAQITSNANPKSSWSKIINTLRRSDK